MLSVVVAACNEEQVIGRCLADILSGAEPDELEIVVVCNGCDDRTASIARTFSPPVTVVETSVASKPKALNLADTVATRFPRFYVDADVRVSILDLQKVAKVLSGGQTLAAAPRLEVDLDGRNWIIRVYYHFWLLLPFLHDKFLGPGIYAVSESGRQAFGSFPEPGGDDRWVTGHFDLAQRRIVAEARFIIPAPFTVGDLIRAKSRHRAHVKFMGDLLTRLPGNPTYGARGVLSVLRKKPYLVLHAFVYMVIAALAEVRAEWKVMRNDRTWDRVGRGSPGQFS